jgi:uncharacterized tellurite resistance protein B-like protein
MKDFTLTEKYAIINILSAIMEADTVIHPKEVEYMNSVMESLQIVVSDLDHLEIQDFWLDRQIIRDMPNDKRTEAKKLFMEMAECDGYVDPREMELIQTIIGICH